MTLYLLRVRKKWNASFACFPKITKIIISSSFISVKIAFCFYYESFVKKNAIFKTVANFTLGCLWSCSNKVIRKIRYIVFLWISDWFLEDHAMKTKSDKLFGSNGSINLSSEPWLTLTLRKHTKWIAFISIFRVYITKINFLPLHAYGLFHLSE